MTTKAETKRLERADAVARLLAHGVQPGETIRVINRHTTPSGMGRFLDLYLPYVDDDGESDLLRITYSAAKVLDWTYSERWEALKVDGCGMDMGFHAVYTLSRCLFPDGFDCIATPYSVCSVCFSRDDNHAFAACADGAWLQRSEGCPSNDHSNREDHAHHSDGGYALTARWL